MIVCFIMVVLFSVIAAKSLPYLYERAKKEVITDSKKLKNENQETKFSIIYSVICIIPSCVIFSLGRDMWLSGVVLILGYVAYTDLMTRWVPDCLIYSCLSVSLLSPQITKDGEMILSVVLFVMPVVIMQIIGYIREGKACVCSGDFYLFPALAVWIAPQYAATVMLISIGLGISISRTVKEVPFITCLFPVFVGYQLCALLFLF